MTGTMVTEPLRAEHRALRPHLAELDNAAASVWAWDTARAVDRLRRLVAFPKGDLVPHAAAEEAVLYPAIEEAMSAPGATATMRADHAEIVACIERLAVAVDSVAERWPDPAVVDDVAVQLTGLAAILDLHFRKEDEVLLPVLDCSLTAEAADALFARMAHAAHSD
jgi:iron-sulfur cluster repair protein YtfE (RIC family)